MAATISDFRITFIWTEALLDVLCGRLAPSNAALPHAVGQEQYVEWFDRTQANWPPYPEPQPPWPKYPYQQFWWAYLGGKDQFNHSLKPITGRVAWKNVVPVLVPEVLAVGYDDPHAAVRTEGLAHPWGVTLLVHVKWSGAAAAPMQVAKTVVDCRNGRSFRLGAQPASLKDVVAAGLKTLRERVFGAGQAGTTAQTPFSLFTVTRADGQPADLDPAANDEIHRLIQACASFSATYDQNPLVPLEPRRVAGRTEQPASHIVYGTARGRVIWGPRFLANDWPKATLSCQQRNLVFAAAQTESLAELARITQTEANVGPLMPSHEPAARRAMIMLGLLYGGSTYRTGSVRHQLEDGGTLPMVDALRARLLPPLPPLTPAA
jgi:hypothetical protein